MLAQPWLRPVNRPGRRSRSYTKSESLLRHALAVEASTAAYARQARRGRGALARRRRCSTTSTTRCTRRSTSIRRTARRSCARRAIPEEVIEAVLSHAEHSALPRDTPLKKALFACDELSGFVHACGLVRPTGLEGLEPKSVRKKLKQPSFAAGVHRDEVYKGAEELGVELDDHIRTVVAALQPIAAELGLPAASRRLGEALQVVLVRPPAARRADEVASG